jgi:cell division protein YceG involved in septum cleavage
MIGVIVSIAAVWTLVIPLYELAFPSKADLKITALTCNSDKIDVAIFNEGKKTGFIKEATFYSIYKKEKSNAKSIGIGKYELVKPGEVIFLTLKGNFEGKTQVSDYCKYHVDFKSNYFSDDSKPKSLFIECECSL